MIVVEGCWLLGFHLVIDFVMFGDEEERIREWHGEMKIEEEERKVVPFGLSGQYLKV